MKKLICLVMAAACLLAGCAAKQEQKEPEAPAEMQSLSEMVQAQQTQEQPAEQPAEEPEIPEAVPEETVQETEEETAPELPEEEPEAEVPEEIPEEIPEEDDGLPDVDLDSWELMLANPTHSIEEYVPETETVEGQPVDARIVEPLTEFVAAARAEGLNVFLSSAYRDYATQNYLYQMKVAQYGDPAVAATIVEPPGTSEHQTGLALDITDRYYELKNSELENTALYQWMSQHCHEYGFIVRYPKDKQEVTGIIYEPWHFRYVGEEVATYIMENGLCLEEFLALYEE